MKFGIALHMERQDAGAPYATVAARLVELLHMADEGGFEVAWAVEHHAHEYLIGPNPLLQLVNWAPQTRRIRLGTAVICAPYWHPIRLAEEIAMADILTGGRLEVGLARGAFQYEFDRMLDGLPQVQGGEHLREALPVIKKLWQGDYEHHGKHWSFPTSTATPKPVQVPHPPLWVASRDEQTFDFAAKNGLNVMTTAHRLPFAEIENLLGKYARALEGNPGAPRRRFMTARMTCVYENPKEWTIPVLAMRDSVRIFMGLFNNESPVVDGFPQPIDLDEKDARGDYRLEALRENMMFGTPEEVVAKLRRYEAAGVDMFNLNAMFGLPYERVVRSLRLFIDEVMPHFPSRPAATAAPAAAAPVGAR